MALLLVWLDYPFQLVDQWSHCCPNYFIPAFCRCSDIRAATDFEFSSDLIHSAINLSSTHFSSTLQVMT